MKKKKVVRLIWEALNLYIVCLVFWDIDLKQLCKEVVANFVIDLFDCYSKVKSYIFLDKLLLEETLDSGLGHLTLN